MSVTLDVSHWERDLLNAVADWNATQKKHKDKKLLIIKKKKESKKNYFNKWFIINNIRYRWVRKERERKTYFQPFGWHWMYSTWRDHRWNHRHDKTLYKRNNKIKNYTEKERKYIENYLVNNKIHYQYKIEMSEKRGRGREGRTAIHVVDTGCIPLWDITVERRGKWKRYTKENKR